MDLLFPSESDEALSSRVEKMDALLQNIQQVLADIRSSLDRAQALELRVQELERTIGTLQGVRMDRPNTEIFPVSVSDRIAPLEAMVNQLCNMSAAQKAALDQLTQVQQKSVQELRAEIHRKAEPEEPAIHEIDDLFRRRQEGR
jgi:hypothetical protein